MAGRSACLAQMIIRMLRILPILGLLLISAATFADAPATQPVSPTLVKRLVSQLNHKDAAVREAARLALMGLKRDDIPTLRDAVAQSVPLEPSQEAVLKDIVTQIYLAGDMYLAEDDGFLGVRLAGWQKPEERALLAIEKGVAIVSRIPGFCAFRHLQDGDVILGVSEGMPINSPDELIAAVSRFKAGQTITFDIQRQGKLMKVSITLDRRPIGLGNNSIDEFIGNRADRANDLWEKTFAPLVAEKLG